MTEYIKREALLDAIDKLPNITEWSFYEDDVVDMARAIPAADVAEVVRCEQCLYRSQYADERGLYKCGAIQCEEDHCILVAPNFACIAGERRDEHG